MTPSPRVSAQKSTATGSFAAVTVPYIFGSINIDAFLLLTIYIGRLRKNLRAGTSYERIYFQSVEKCDHTVQHTVFFIRETLVHDLQDIIYSIDAI